MIRWPVLLRLLHAWIHSRTIFTAFLELWAEWSHLLRVRGRRRLNNVRCLQRGEHGTFLELDALRDCWRSLVVKLG